MAEKNDPTLDKITVRLLNDLNGSIQSLNDRFARMERLLQGDLDDENSGGLKKTVRDINAFLGDIRDHFDDMLGAAKLYKSLKRFRLAIGTIMLGIIGKLGYDFFKFTVDLAVKAATQDAAAESGL